MNRKLLYVDAIVDHRGVVASPGAVLKEGNTILAVGTPQEIGTPENAPLTQSEGIITPTFVNTHAHLDLSGRGNVPAKSSFLEWVKEVVLPIRRDEEGIQNAVHAGIKLIHAGGSAIVGDIAGSIMAASTAQASARFIISYVEFLESAKELCAMQQLLQELPEAFDVSPHAPYSCGAHTYEAAFASNRKVATHVAETLEEIEYTLHKTGPIAAFEKQIGVWNEQEKPWGMHPVDIGLSAANGKPFIAAHVHYIEDRHLDMLADSLCTVAYCPRASEYFGHTNHRWQEMVDAGVRISIGTDSLLCLDTPDRISVIDELRLLYRRDNADPRLLMKMGTTAGAIGVGVDPSLVAVAPGETAGLLLFNSVPGDPVHAIMNSTEMPVWL